MKPLWNRFCTRITCKIIYTNHGIHIILHDMMLLQSKVLLLLLMISAGILLAQPRPYEERADSILAEAGEILKAHEAIRMTFLYTMQNEERQQYDHAEGFILTRGDKYYLKQGMHHLISDGITAWTFLEEVNEVHISYAEDIEAAMSPVSVLDNFRDDFQARWVRLEPLADEDIHIIDLVPRQPQTFYKFRVAIDDQSKNMVFMEAHDRQGGKYRYEIETIDTKPDISEEKFTFQPEDHPDIEVVDLR